MRIAAPPSTHPCFYGIATPTREELIAARMTVEEIRKYVDADTLGYLSIEDMQVSLKDKEFCSSCFTGNYVVPPVDPAAAGRMGS